MHTYIHTSIYIYTYICLWQLSANFDRFARFWKLFVTFFFWQQLATFWQLLVIFGNSQQLLQHLAFFVVVAPFSSFWQKSWKYLPTFGNLGNFWQESAVYATFGNF